MPKVAIRYRSSTKSLDEPFLISSSSSSSAFTLLKYAESGDPLPKLYQEPG
jgi:hypothetical protein